MAEYDARLDGARSYDAAIEAKHRRQTAALVVLAQAGIDADTRNLLVYGSSDGRIKPGSLDAAISAAIRAMREGAR